MNAAISTAVVSKFGDASGKLLELIKRADELASTVAPNTPESNEFFDIISQINNYLAEYGFQLVIIIIMKKRGCVLRLAFHDTAPTKIKQ